MLPLLGNITRFPFSRTSQPLQEGYVTEIFTQTGGSSSLIPESQLRTHLHVCIRDERHNVSPTGSKLQGPRVFGSFMLEQLRGLERCDRMERSVED